MDEFLPHPAAAVWEALTSSDQLAVWLMPNDFRAEVGHRFTLDTGNWGATERAVVEIEPQRLLRYSWRNGPLDTEVTWRLVPEGHGTRLLLEHTAGPALRPPRHEQGLAVQGPLRSA